MSDLTQAEINEALALLIREGLVTVTINEDGERVFRLIETKEPDE
jgi:hypothetical protein